MLGCISFIVINELSRGVGIRSVRKDDLGSFLVPQAGIDHVDGANGIDDSLNSEFAPYPCATNKEGDFLLGEGSVVDVDVVQPAEESIGGIALACLMPADCHEVQVFDVREKRSPGPRSIRI